MSKAKPEPSVVLEDVVPEATSSLAELVAMRRIPDHHAFALRQYVGDDTERPLAEWDSLYKEMMSKPTDMPKAQWHETFVKNSK
jgi:hypothetical protein